jgi:uncharacterized protein YuzE
MKISYDHVVEAVYIDLVDAKAVCSEEVNPGVIFDYDQEGRLVGIEILGIKDMGALV